VFKWKEPALVSPSKDPPEPPMAFSALETRFSAESEKSMEKLHFAILLKVEIPTRPDHIKYTDGDLPAEFSKISVAKWMPIIILRAVCFVKTLIGLCHPA
jgi:hypothetical protein